MTYAIIRTGGKQYRVSPGDLIRVEALPGDVGTGVQFSEVLLTRQGEEIQVGRPLVSGAEVSGTIIAQGKARKVIVFKKKRRKNYRRKRGHRQLYTTVRVTGVHAPTGEAHGT